MIFTEFRRHWQRNADFAERNVSPQNASAANSLLMTAGKFACVGGAVTYGGSEARIRMKNLVKPVTGPAALLWMPPVPVMVPRLVQLARSVEYSIW
ncbi:MAG: hypothetical protein RL088_2293 [Verrucomicrobiota bacterium]